MMKKTHLAVGAAAGLAAGMITGTFSDAIHPVGLLIASVPVSAAAGVLPDIDSASTAQHRDADAASAGIVVGILVLALAGHYLGGLWAVLWAKSVSLLTGAVSGMAGLVGIIALCIIGKDTSHRSFTHSFLALIAFTACVNIFSPSLAVFTAAGYASHIVIDFLNRKGERLLYPLPGRFSLGLCSSDGLCNHIMLIAGTAAAAILFLIAGIRAFL